MIANGGAFCLAGVRLHEGRKMWTIWGWIGFIGSMALSVLVVLYISESWFRTRWEGLSKPISLLEVAREWIVFMLVFGGLTVSLQKMLDSACWKLCFEAINTVRKP
jgi:hypothetical protein